MEKIKKEYPRLPVCIQGDALYATEPMMKLCREKYHWAYIFTQKETRQKLLDEGFEWIKSGGVKKVSGLCEEKGTGCYANHAEEVAGKKEIMNVFEYEYEKKNKKREIAQKNHFPQISKIGIPNPSYVNINEKYE